MVFDNLPTPPPAGGDFSGQITVSNPTPSLGDLVTVEVVGNGVVALAQAREATGVSFRGFDMDIGPLITLRGVNGIAYGETVTVPNNPLLRGLHLWFQGAVELDSTPRLTEPRVLIVQ